LITNKKVAPLMSHLQPWNLCGTQRLSGAL